MSKRQQIKFHLQNKQTAKFEQQLATKIYVYAIYIMTIIWQN